MKAALWVLALFVGYKILRFYVVLLVGAGLVAALVLVVLFFAFVDQAYKATYSPPPRRGRR
jgi:chromate transport protein ChrA